MRLNVYPEDEIIVVAGIKEILEMHAYKAASKFYGRLIEKFRAFVRDLNLFLEYHGTSERT